MTDTLNEQDTQNTSAEDSAADTAAEESASFDLASAGVDVMLRFFVGILGQLAWRSLGLVADPKTGETKVDLKEARLAIDVLGDVVNRLNPSLTPAESREMNNLLTNLRLNYADKTKVEPDPTQKD